MPAPVMTYSPFDVTVNIGDYVIPGVVRITITWNEIPFRLVRGIRGVNTRVRSRDNSATLTLELLQTSIGNDVLYQILEQDIVFGSARLELSVSDLSGGLRVFTDQAFVQKYPDVQLSNDLDNRVWEIGMLNVKAPELGGNSKTATDYFQNISQRISSLFSED